MIETVTLNNVIEASFMFYKDERLKIVRRKGESRLLEDDVGNRMWVHHSFIKETKYG